MESLGCSGDSEDWKEDLHDLHDGLHADIALRNLYDGHRWEADLIGLAYNDIDIHDDHAWDQLGTARDERFQGFIVRYRNAVHNLQDGSVCDLDGGHLEEVVREMEKEFETSERAEWRDRDQQRQQIKTARTTQQARISKQPPRISKQPLQLAEQPPKQPPTAHFVPAQVPLEVPPEVLEVSLDVPPKSQDVLPPPPESLESMLLKLGNVQAAIKQHTAAQFAAQLPAQRTVEPKTHASPHVALQSDAAHATAQPVSLEVSLDVPPKSHEVLPSPPESLESMFHATAQPNTIEVLPLVVQVKGVAPSRQRTRSELKRLAEPAELHKAYTTTRVVDFEQKKQIQNELAKMVKNLCFVGWGKHRVLSEEVHEGIMSDAMATVIRTATQKCEVEAQNTRDRVGRLLKAG